MTKLIQDSDLLGQKAIKIINFAKDDSIQYDATEFESGYHSLSIAGKDYKGQRDNTWRMKDIPFDFDQKNILDIGCNAGGILHHLSGRIAYGMGLDFNSKLINAANLIKSINKENNLDFYVFNLEQDALEMIKELYLGTTIDIIFLLSVCMWLGNWQQVIDFCVASSPALVFETNGSKEQQTAQIQYLTPRYKKVDLVYQSSLDDPKQAYRMMLFCSNAG